MSSIKGHLSTLKKALPEQVTLVAVSKTKPVSDLMEAYEAGQRIFGENKIQEMTQKQEVMPKDCIWHMIGHVQTNKIKYMAPYVALIHAVDSMKLLQEINKQAQKHDRVIACLLQIKIATEPRKFGISSEEAAAMLEACTNGNMPNVKVTGLMGMATFTADTAQLEREFKHLKTIFKKLSTTYPQLHTLSMGMSGDYKIAIAHGSTMVRIGSSIFGTRNYN